MTSAEIEDFSKRVRAQLYSHILPFWSGPALDQEHGGWLPWMSNDLRVDRSKPKGLIVNSRILWAFSAAFRQRPDPVFRQMADRAFEFLMARFWDAQYGGAFWQLDDKGMCIDASRKIYGQAFVIYAVTEYYLAFKVTSALDHAKALFELIETHAYDPRDGGYWEVRRRDWSEELSDTRLSDKDMNEKKSMNNHLHVLEAYTNLYRTWKEPRVEQRLRELIAIFEHRILDARTRHFHHFFNEQWMVRSNTYTFGHDIEGSWLLCEAAEVLGAPGLLCRVRAIALEMAEAVYDEGLDQDGGLCYEGRAGRIIDSRKECWPQAEAVVGFINAFQLSSNVKYFAAARRVWSYIEDHLVDRVYGEWFWRINIDGQPDPDLPKVSEWKGPYHGSRACLEALPRLAQIHIS